MQAEARGHSLFHTVGRIHRNRQTSNCTGVTTYEVPYWALGYCGRTQFSLAELVDPRMFPLAHSDPRTFTTIPWHAHLSRSFHHIKLGGEVWRDRITHLFSPSFWICSRKLYSCVLAFPGIIMLLYPFSVGNNS